MKRLLFLLALAILATNSETLADKRYTIDAVRIRAVVDSSGGVWISESRTYTYKGRFSFATYELALRGIPDISNIEVSEGGRGFSEIAPGDDARPGSFCVERKNDALHVRWNYEAKDETRTFELRFYLKGVAVAHADVAEFYYKFIGTGWDRQTGDVEVMVQLTAPVPINDVKAWVHGPLHGICAVLAAGLVRFEVAPLPKRTFWEGRVIFPKEVLSAAFSRTDRIALPTILEEERVWAEEANRAREGAIRKVETQRAWREQNLPWLIAANLGGVIFLFYLYNRFGRSLIGTVRVEPSPPQDISPALANYYYAGSTLSAGALVSTLLDLARRGFLTIREESKDAGFLGWHWKKQEYTLLFHKSKINDGRSRLLRHELDLLRYLQDEIAQGAESIPFSAIVKSRGKFQKWFRQWRKQIKTIVADKKYFDPESMRAAVRCCLGMLSLIGLGILATVKMGEAGIPFILSGVALAGLSLTIIRYSKETAVQRGRLLGFRGYLSRIAKNRSSGMSFNLQNLEPALIYAMAMDLPSGALKKLLHHVEHSLGAVNYPWYIYGSTSHRHSGFAEAMSGMMTAASTTMSSASGAGGGASAGGGGGAGGSGGGAG